MPNRIRLLRKRRGLTLQGLGELCGTSHATIQRLESGKLDINSRWIVALSKALDVHPGELFDPLPGEDMPEAAEAAKLAVALGPEQRRFWLTAGRALAADPGEPAGEVISLKRRS